MTSSWKIFLKKPAITSFCVDARTTANQAPQPANPQQVTTNKTEEQKAINGRNPESVKRVTAPPETPLLEKSNVIYVEPRPTPSDSSSGETKVIHLGGPINSNDRPDVIYLGQAPEKKNPEQ